MARMLGVDPDRLVVDQVGLNHLTWVRAVWFDERDVLGELIAEFGDRLPGQAGGADPRVRRSRPGGGRRAAAAAARAARRRSLVLPALLLRARRRAVLAARGGDAAGGAGGRDRARAADHVRRPGADHQAGAARAARRR